MNYKLFVTPRSAKSPNLAEPIKKGINCNEQSFCLLNGTSETLALAGI